MSYNEVENKFNENLKFGKLNSENHIKIKSFVDTFFEKPNFKLLI